MVLPASAATVAPWVETFMPGSTGEMLHPYDDVLAAKTVSYRDAPGSPPLFVPGLLLHILALGTYAFSIATALPGSRSNRYAAWAAAAMSRTRWTMARKPFERCDDRWSFSPSRASSAGASTASTSPTVRSS